MSSQLYFPEHEHEFKDEGECKRCGIRLSEEFQHRHYSDIRRPAYSRRLLSEVHAQGICIVCRNERAASSASSQLLVWGVHNSPGRLNPHRNFGFPAKDKSIVGCNLDTWPSMEDFAACLEQQLELSSEDELFRRLVRARNDIAVAAEEFENEENELKSAG